MLCLLTACTFAAPRLFGWDVYAVASGSMEPTYPVGALVFTRAVDPETVQKGDCITYRDGEATVTHRVVDTDQEQEIFITKGDANLQEDGAVGFERLVGRTERFYLPYLGYLAIWLKGAGTWVLGVLLLLCVFLILQRVLPAVTGRRAKRPAVGAAGGSKKGM